MEVEVVDSNVDGVGFVQSGYILLSSLSHDITLVSDIRALTLGDSALLYIAQVMLIWVGLIPATRWSCSQSPTDSSDC